jgi:hypothetical protein
MRQILLCILLFVNGIAYGEFHALRPGAFATFGDYTNGGTSREFSGFVTYAVNNRQYFTVGYSDESISFPESKYHQQMPVGGVLLSRLPFSVKVYYAHIVGNYTYKPFRGFDYDDRADVVSGEVAFTRYPFTFGVAYAHFTGNGLSYADNFMGKAPKQNADQLTGRISVALSPRWTVIARPNVVRVKDGRNLTSLAMKLVYLPHRRWTATGGGFIGERAYYFDNDLLTIFNQNDTQRGMIFGEAEFRAGKGFSLTAEYLYTRFAYTPVFPAPGRDYDIRYVVAGIKYYLPL